MNLGRATRAEGREMNRRNRNGERVPCEAGSPPKPSAQCTHYKWLGLHFLLLVVLAKFNVANVVFCGVSLLLRWSDFTRTNYGALY